MHIQYMNFRIKVIIHYVSACPPACQDSVYVIGHWCGCLPLWALAVHRTLQMINARLMDYLIKS